MENNSEKYIVYLTMNMVNGKIYIGVHQTENPNVFDGYIGCGAYVNKPTTYNKSDIPLHCAIKKYGTHSFRRTTLRIFDKLEDALDLEAWLVTKEFISRPDTYNATIGGGMPPNLSKKVYQFNPQGELIKEWASESDIKRFYQCRVSLSDIIKSKRSFAGCFWSFEKTIDVTEYKTELNHGFINQYNKYGVLLNQFKNTTIAAQKLDLQREAITQAVFKKKLYNGYYFLKADVDIAEVLSSKYKPKLGLTHIFRYDINGNLIKEYETVTKAKVDISAYKLKKAIVDGILMENSYWSYYKSTNYFNIKTRTKPIIKIAQYNKFGELIKVWNSPKEVKLKYPQALRCCQGTLKSAHGYIFKYIQN